MLRDYTGIKPDLYKRYMDDVAGAASCTEDDLTRFLTFVSSYHPKLEYTWSISSAKLPFLDMYLIPRYDRVVASIYYKETDSHYLSFTEVVPSFQVSNTLKDLQRGWKFQRSSDYHGVFVPRGYPVQLVQQGKLKAASIPKALLLAGKDSNQTGTKLVPMVATYHSKNTPVCKILSRNYNILTTDVSDRVIFHKHHWRAKNMRNLLVHRDFRLDQPAQQLGTRILYKQ